MDLNKIPDDEKTTKDSNFDLEIQKKTKHLNIVKCGIKILENKKKIIENEINGLIKNKTSSSCSCFRGIRVNHNEDIDLGSRSLTPGSPQNPDADTQIGINAKRQLAFQNENIGGRKIAPSTPSGAKSSASLLIDIDRSDDEHDIPTIDEFQQQLPGIPIRKRGLFISDDIPTTTDEFEFEQEPPFSGTPKRKRGLKVFSSDEEPQVEEPLPRKRNFKIYNSDNDGHDNDDDDIPISQIKMKCGQILNQLTSPRVDNSDGLTRSRRRLVKTEQDKKKGGSQETENRVEIQSGEEDDDDDGLSRCRRRLFKSEQGEKKGRKRNMFIENDEGDYGEEDYSNSDDSSLDNFIVDEDDEEDVADDGSGEDDTSDSHAPEDSSDDNVDFKEIISRLQRRKSPNSKWDLEVDMLSAFAKDSELCMKAVCALYRRQTSDEKFCKESIVQNGRGFSKFDASRGTRLGDFLTGGDPNGDVVKSKEELQAHDPYALKHCFRLAKHYSKQLFEIYQNGEDCFFP